MRAGAVRRPPPEAGARQGGGAGGGNAARRPGQRQDVEQGLGSLAQAAQPPSQAARPRAGGEAKGAAFGRGESSGGGGGGAGARARRRRRGCRGRRRAQAAEDPPPGGGREEGWGAPSRGRTGGPSRRRARPVELGWEARSGAWCRSRKDPQPPMPCSPQVAHNSVMSRPKARSRGGRGPGRIRAPLSDSGECKGRDRGGGRGPCPERLARARRDGRRGGAWGELSKPLPFSRRKAPLRAGARRARAPRSQTLGPGRAGVTSRPERSGGRANRAEGSARSGGGRRSRPQREHGDPDRMGGRGRCRRHHRRTARGVRAAGRVVHAA